MLIGGGKDWLELSRVDSGSVVLRYYVLRCSPTHHFEQSLDRSFAKSFTPELHDWLPFLLRRGHTVLGAFLHLDEMAKPFLERRDI